ncbi:MAG: ProQ/FINO family protein, partial [Pseudomonadota bacterium]|nr:ProQ/FINO family protein [Pseudomonadota bacterium]
MQETLPPADNPTPTDPAPVSDALPNENVPSAPAEVEAEVKVEPDNEKVAAGAAVDPTAAPTERPTESPTETKIDTSADTTTPEADHAAPKPAALPPVPDLAPAACAALLAQHFPALFGKGVFLPIKLRIQADIQARVPGVFNKKTLSIFLHRHTTGTAYIKALVKATQRFDLEGQPDGEIAAEHHEAAVAELARRREIVDGRRAQERETQRAKQQDERNAARKAQQAREAAQHSAEHEARRERAALLRAFESSTLTRANFCALKGIPEDTLDARLDQAWHEREARAHEAPPRPTVAQRRPEERSARGEREGRGDRHERGRSRG